VVFVSQKVYKKKDVFFIRLKVVLVKVLPFIFVLRLEIINFVEDFII
jgi:hypothetical protein